MDQGRIAELERRGVVSVGGPEATLFLNDLITNDVAGLAEDGAGYGGLLTPQGKILFDFIVFRTGGGFLFDIRREAAAAFAKRLGFYKLRAKVEVADLTGQRTVFAAWGSETPPAVSGVVARDPRVAALGFRGIAAPGISVAAPGYSPSHADAYDRHRVELGVPEGGIDFAFGESFPHDVDMDQIAGIDFKKGCYVGQEVVSRMEHRGTARRRFILAEGATALETGAALAANGRALGTIGSTSGNLGLALVRLDRAREARDAGIDVTAASVPVALRIPEWARFDWPSGPSED
jgi:folate-binding protein YgfZ